jgi:general secretion pathway protein J
MLLPEMQGNRVKFIDVVVLNGRIARDRGSILKSTTMGISEAKRPLQAEMSGAKSGFTLIELMVAFILLSLIFLLLTSGLGLGTKIWEVKKGSSDTSEVLPVQNFLRRMLGEVRPVVVEASPFARHVFFAGKENSVRFIAPMPGNLGTGGFFEVAVYLTEGDQFGGQVEMSWHLFRRQDGLSKPVSDQHREILINGVTEIQFAYFGYRKTNEPARWYSDWQDLQALPDLIRMRVKFSDSDRNWPELIAAPIVRSVNLIIQNPETESDLDHLPSAPHPPTGPLPLSPNISPPTSISF